MHLDQIVNIHCTDTDKNNSGRVVRMHPNMSTMPITEIDNYFSLSLLKNVTILRPLDQTDTYALLDHAEIVIGFCSSIIIESAYYGKNTFLIGPSPYLGLGMGTEFKNAAKAADYLLKGRTFIKPNKINAIMWAVYINLYNDELEGFSLKNTYPLVDGKKIPTVTFWRLLAGFEKLYFELFRSNKSSIKFKNKLIFILKRFKSILKKRWSEV